MTNEERAAAALAKLREKTLGQLTYDDLVFLTEMDKLSKIASRVGYNRYNIFEVERLESMAGEDFRN